MEELLRNQLLHLAELYGEASGLPFTRIGSRMMRDSSFLIRIRDGDGFNVKTFDKAVAWFSTNWPDGVIWPDNVERPAKEQAA